MSFVRSRPVQLRLHPDDVERIDQLARQHKLSRTEYMLRASLHKLGTIGLDDRVQALEQRVQTLERNAELRY